MPCCAQTSLNFVKSAINARFVGKEPWQIIACTTSTVLLTVWIYNFVFDDERKCKYELHLIPHVIMVFVASYNK